MWLPLFSFGSLMLSLSDMLFTLSFCPLFTVILLWLWLFLVWCCVLPRQVSLVLFPIETLFNCTLLVYVLFCCVSGFQIVLGCLLQDLAFYVSLTDPGGICSAAICVVFTCLLFLVISHPFFFMHIVYNVFFCGYELLFLLL